MNGKSIYKKIIEGGNRTRIEPGISIKQGMNLIHDLLQQPQPCMIARFGYVELDVLIRYLMIKRQDKAGLTLLHKLTGGRTPYLGWSQDITYPFKNNAGFFSNSVSNIEKYCELMFDTMPNLDILACTVPGEKIMLKYIPQAKLIPLRSLEPYYESSAPWTRILKGKKILVIHPFTNTITSQYKRRALLFDEKSILPDFELKTLKSVQSAADSVVPYKDWFEALDYMKKKIEKIDFDIALLGCGAYGFPLSSFIKDLGKKSVYIGGAIQIFFGIKGLRWDNHPIISTLYNDYWIRPDNEDIPVGAEKIEGGCYW